MHDYLILFVVVCSLLSALICANAYVGNNCNVKFRQSSESVIVESIDIGDKAGRTEAPSGGSLSGL